MLKHGRQCGGSENWSDNSIIILFLQLFSSCLADCNLLTTYVVEAADSEMDGKKKKEAGCFQMPLHYPKYTMKDYQTMPEWQLDRLLADYGLPVHDELAYKREFAIGAFLWPNFQQEQKTSTSHI
ncbi:hypothetical protein SADUNF_Sadunf17G0049500 [Salix dunnii]|uniref:DUF7722 domain-containing protein n=1 Tax=Salix dunnii TaxID=1413687 RepID=A0A835J4L5_9ROSI|nr:hypothetical protein SADUNF_Sadunf17G0049500 [Salix dunnii]